MKQMLDGFQKLKEQMSTSLSICHLGHYKCLLILDNNKVGTTIKHFNTTMLIIYNTIMNAVLAIRYPLARKKKSEVSMIPKEKTTIKINQLRVINKYETDYSLVLKFFWPKLVIKQSDRANILGENQSDAKPLCSAKHSALINEIIIDIHRITCRNLVKL